MRGTPGFPVPSSKRPATTSTIDGNVFFGAETYASTSPGGRRDAWDVLKAPPRYGAVGRCSAKNARVVDHGRPVTIRPGR